MIRLSCLTIIVFILLLPVAAQTDAGSNAFLDPQSAPKSNSQEEQLYASASQALNNGDYDQAITGFNQVSSMKGRRADAALYWKAYALNKAQRRSEALTALAQLRRDYPQSSYLKEAKVLEMDIHPANPEALSDEDLKPYAVDALLNTSPEKAFPILEKLLQGNSSLRVKDRALFVLAQSDYPKAQQLLLSIAKGSTAPELQEHAIRWLATGGTHNAQVLREIYASATTTQVKKQVLRSFIMSGDKEGLLNIIRQEKSPELRREGIRQLGPMGAAAELRQIYKESTDPETKETALQALGVAGDSQGLIEIAKTEPDPQVRARAIRNVGIFGGTEGLNALLSIYNSANDTASKKAVIQALFIHGAAKTMVELARKETDPELKKDLVRNLALMDSPEAHDYMLEILNK
jgi:HEAT repeat protein